MLLNVIKPKFFVPVHGEYRHLLAHGALAETMGVSKSGVFVLEDGDVLELTKDHGEVTNRIPMDDVYVEGRNITTSKDSVLQDRRSLSKVGIVVVAVALDGKTGLPVGLPKVLSAGFSDSEEMKEVFSKVSESVSESLDHTPNYPIDWKHTNQVIKDTATKLLQKETHRSPIVVPVSVEV